MNNKIIGRRGEDIAKRYLIDKKYKILEENFKCKIGEIDIIASDGEYIIFVEVKTRTSTKYGIPCQAVNFYKQRIIGKVASLYLSNNKLYNEMCRFDIVGILIMNKQISISHIENAFCPKVI